MSNATDEKKESILVKVRKMMDKAAATDSAAEAETFMAAAQKLLQAYNLEMSQVKREDTKDRSITGVIVNCELRSQQDLIHIVSRYNLCQAIFLGNDSSQAEIIGATDNVNVVVFLFNFFHQRLMDLSLPAYLKFVQDRKAEIDSIVAGGGASFKPPKSVERRYLAEYLEGGIQGVKERLREQEAQFKLNSAGATGMIVSNKSAINLYVGQKYKNLRHSKGAAPKKPITNGFEAGRMDGYSLNKNSALS